MADEKETQPTPAAPIDMNALAQQLQVAAARGTAAAIDEVARQTQQRQAAAERAAQTQADPVASTVLPVVAPLFREVAIKADSGRDAAVFYATTPAAHRFSGLVEQRFNDLAARGIPVDRASLWNLIKGERGLTADGETFEDAMKRRDAEVKAAQEAATVRGSRGVPTAQVREATSMTLDELTAALDNIAF